MVVSWLSVRSQILYRTFQALTRRKSSLLCWMFPCHQTLSARPHRQLARRVSLKQGVHSDALVGISGLSDHLTAYDHSAAYHSEPAFAATLRRR
jgi:hypothetical protein